jgi:hypothetical protein
MEFQTSAFRSSVIIESGIPQLAGIAMATYFGGPAGFLVGTLLDSPPWT